MAQTFKIINWELKWQESQEKQKTLNLTMNDIIVDSLVIGMIYINLRQNDCP